MSLYFYVFLDCNQTIIKLHRFLRVLRICTFLFLSLPTGHSCYFICSHFCNLMNLQCACKNNNKKNNKTEISI